MCNQLPPSFKFLLTALLLVTPACVVDDGEAAGDTDAATDTATSGDTDDSSASTGEAACVLITPEDVTGDLTLPTGCYEVDTLLSIDGTTLTMEPGADITFAPQAGLVVTGTGVVTATGTPELPVDLHGQTEDPGAWQGIVFANAASSSNLFEGTLVRNSTGISVSDGSRLRIAASEIVGTAGFGVVAADGSEFTIESTLLEANTTPLSVGLSTVEGVGPDNAFTDNAEQIVLVTGQTSAAASTWQAVGVPFRLENRIFVAAPLTMEPGVTVTVPQDASIIVETQGQLSATGTADAPITFSGVQPEDGFWQGIEIRSNSSNNVFDQCVIEYAGSSDWYGGGDASGSVYVPEEGKVIIRNTTIRNSGWYGVLASRGSDLSGFEGNVLADNERTFRIPVNQGGNIGADTVFENNTEQRARISMSSSDRIDTDQTWPALGVPWFVTTRFYVDADWTLAAGAVVDVAQDAQIYVEPEGSLHAAGTPDQPVILRGSEALSGYWAGMSFESASASNLLENTTIEHAGSDAWEGGTDKEAALYLSENSVLQLTDTTIRDSAGHGLLMSGGAATCSGVVFEGIANDNVSGMGSTGCL